MDHVARFAIHNETNVCTRRRFRIGVLWKHCCLHILSLNLICFIDSLKHRAFLYTINREVYPTEAP